MNTMCKRNLLPVLIVVAGALGGELAWAEKSAQTEWDLKPTTATSRTTQLTEPVLERIQNIETKMVEATEGRIVRRWQGAHFHDHALRIQARHRSQGKGVLRSSAKGNPGQPRSGES